MKQSQQSIALKEPYELIELLKQIPREERFRVEGGIIGWAEARKTTPPITDAPQISPVVG